jgi:hypothetical protein
MAQGSLTPQSEYGDRVEFEHQFKWNAATREWETTTGRKVYVKPAESSSQYWMVRVPSTQLSVPLCGEDVERRAFCVAEVYSRQQD